MSNTEYYGTMGITLKWHEILQYTDSPMPVNSLAKTFCNNPRVGSQYFCLHRIVTRSQCKCMLQCKNRKNSIPALLCFAMRIQINFRSQRDTSKILPGFRHTRKIKKGEKEDDNFLCEQWGSTTQLWLTCHFSSVFQLFYR